MFAVQNKKAYPAQGKWYNLVTLKYSEFKIENLYEYSTAEGFRSYLINLGIGISRHRQNKDLNRPSTTPPPAERTI